MRALAAASRTIALARAFSTAATTHTNSSTVTKRKTVTSILKRVREGKKLSLLTAYDAGMAARADEHVDFLLVGDSLAMTVLGHDSTIPVSLDTMILHCAAVSRGSKAALCVGDLPFGSYQTADMAVSSSVRMIQEGGMQAVKLEGGAAHAHKIARIVAEGIPVMGHVGLSPEAAPAATASDVAAVIADAKAVADAGAFAIVLALTPYQAGAIIQAELPGVPLLGIGSGPYVHGQALVSHDLLGLSVNAGHPSKFTKQYAALGAEMSKAFAAFAADVATDVFPGPPASGASSSGNGNGNGNRYYFSLSKEEEAALARMRATNAGAAAEANATKMK